MDIDVLGELPVLGPHWIKYRRLEPGNGATINNAVVQYNTSRVLYSKALWWGRHCRPSTGIAWGRG
jgi:hypothetical protein